MRNKKEREALPARLTSVRRRFEQWRQRRKGRDRIPERLWAAAANVAATYGIHRTAKALGLDYAGLKKHVKPAAPQPSSPPEERPPAFVEVVPAPSANSRDCVIELENRGGVKMRIRFAQAHAANLLARLTPFWGGRR